MSDIVIGFSPETRWQRFKRSVRKIHPIVKGAVVVGIFSLLGLSLDSVLESGSLQSKVSGLEEAVKARDITIRNKTADIQRLETLLTPFRTIALERYTGSEGEALRQLADQIGILQNADRRKSEKITQLEAELDKTKSLAEPCKLALYSKTIKKERDGYRVALIFKPTKNEQLGLLRFAAALPINSSARMLDFWPTKGSVFSSGKDSKKIGDDGKSARLIYSLVGFGNPSVDLVVSGPTKIQIKGNNGLKTFEVDIK